MSLKAVFFDLDGTLLDTAPDLARALNRLLEESGKAKLSETEIRKVVSDGAYALLELGFGIDREHADTPELRQRLLDLYAEDLASGTTVFPGIENLIDELTKQGIAWGIVTNKPEPYAVPLMKNFSFASDPICLICPENVSERKPDPEALVLACQYAQCDVDAAIYIGDHLRDIQCGLNAGMPTIAVSYGYVAHHDCASSWGAKHVVDSADEIWPVVSAYLREP